MSQGRLGRVEVKVGEGEGGARVGGVGVAERVQKSTASDSPCSDRRVDGIFLEEGRRGLNVAFPGCQWSDVLKMGRSEDERSFFFGGGGTGWSCPRFYGLP